MIVGIGVDIVEIAKIARYAQRETFSNRVYTAYERTFCRNATCPDRSWAEIFACKEAFLKALGEGIGRGISLQDIEIRYQLDGWKHLTISGKARTALHKMAATSIHLDSASSRTLVVAVVVLAER